MRDTDDESRPEKKRRVYACKDRMCGALDCATCFPNTYDEPDCESELDESEADEE